MVIGVRATAHLPQRVAEIGELAPLPAAPFDHLVQVHRIGERAEAGGDVGPLRRVAWQPHVDRGAELDAPDLDLSPPVVLERLQRILVFDRHVAAVETHAHVLAERRRVQMRDRR